MTQDEAMQKAAKLLRLSKSSNPHEAALAATRAQEIMDRYKIDSLSVENPTVTPDEPIKNFGFDPVDTTPYATWKGRLCLVLASMNQCICYKGQGGTLCLIGRPSDVTTVRYIYGWLVREIEALATENCAGTGRTYANNYRIGAQETVCQRLKAAQGETRKAAQAESQTVEAATPEQSALALVRVNHAIEVIERRAVEVKDWQKKNFKLGSGSSSRARYNSTARDAGRRDGHQVRMQPSAGSLGNGHRQLSNAG